MSHNPRRRRTHRAAAAAAVLALAVAASGALAAPAPSPSFGQFAGYVWRSGPVHEIHATWTVARIRRHSPKLSVAGTWIGAQAPGRPGPFIQIGTTSVHSAGIPGVPGRNIYSAFWSDTRRHFAAIPLFPVRAGDVVSASMTLERGRWRLAIVDATSGLKSRFFTPEEAGAAFNWAEWLQEDPTSNATHRGVPYPRLSPTRFRQLGVNWKAPAYASVYSQWMTVKRGDVAPTALKGDAFAIVPATPTATGTRYLRIIEAEDAASNALYAQLAGPAAERSRPAILTAGAALAVAIRDSARALARHRWPPRVRRPIDKLIRDLRPLLARLRALAGVPFAGLSAWNAGFVNASRPISHDGHVIRRRLHVPELT
jgi:hypothetical protein